MQKKSFAAPDETKTPPNMKIENIKMDDFVISKQTFQSGWQWSKHIKPIAKTSSCQTHHAGVWISGRMHVRADDGQEMEFSSGDVADIPPGHDEWVVGDDPAVFFAFSPKINPK